MFTEQKCVLVFVGVLFIASHMAFANSFNKDELDEAPRDELDQSQLDMKPEVENLEDSDLSVNAAPSEVDKRKIRIKCRCWIGWRGNQNKKYINFGVIRKFKVFTWKKQSKCSASCSAKCASSLKKKNLLCIRIGKNYNYKQNKVGCFSKVGKYDTKNNLWDFDGTPHKLCCKRYRRNCKTVYGTGFYYHSVLKLCVRFIATGCGVGISGLTPPVCCYSNKLYNCLYAKRSTKSVKC